MEKPIPLKTSIEVSRIRKPCHLIESLFLELKSRIAPGVSTGEINKLCSDLLAAGGAASALKGYRGFPGVVCTSVNNVAAHGIPGTYRLQPGDLVTVDVTAKIDGWHGDGAWTFLVGTGAADSRRLLKAAWQATMAGIKAARAGNRLGDVGAAIEAVGRRFGCGILEKFVGHGIGVEMHEEPMVLNFGSAGSGQAIVPGMVFTVEPILCLGDPAVRVLGDSWSIVTVDGGLSAQFEQTVAIFGDRTELLTLSSVARALELELPPFY